MQENFFMQLFIILALLLYGGKSGAQNLLNEVKPMLEAFGGDEVKDALKSAEEISEVISSISSLVPLAAFSQPAAQTSEAVSSEDVPVGGFNESANDAFPLAPITNVANREITYCLSKYVETH